MSYVVEIVDLFMLFFNEYFVLNEVVKEVFVGEIVFIVFYVFKV